MKLSDHLEDIEIKKYQAPTTSNPDRLPFDLMEPKMFERFCCDLVDYKINYELRQDIVNVLPIGKSGQKQYGADIFVKEVREGEAHFSLYEVKRVKDYDFNKYKKAVERFLDNYKHWGVKIDKFYLFVADDISADMIVLWQKQVSKLSELDIEYQVVAVKEINEWVRDFPELAYKYFHPAWTELYWGPSAIWHIEKYGLYRFEESASWVGYEGVEHETYEDFFSYKNDHVRIQGFLPSLKQKKLSCFVEFRNGKFSHVMTTLDGEHLIQRYFIGADIPIDEYEHPFLLKDTVNVSDRFFCDIGNSRMQISREEAEHLTDAMRVFRCEYIKRIETIEKVWRSSNFSTYAYKGPDVPLIRIKRGLWSLLLKFSRCNDVFDTEGEWSIFDRDRSRLKIYTKNGSKNMEAGYHVVITPQKSTRESVSYTSADDDVILVWTPPSDFMISDNDGKIGPRYYWDAKTTHDWLVNEMIPVALDYLEKKGEKNNRPVVELIFSLFKKNKTQDDVYDPDRYLTSFYIETGFDKLKQVNNIQDLLSVIDELQNFFSCTDKLYVEINSYKKIYSGLAELMSKTDMHEDDFDHIKSNLNYLKAENYQDLIRSLKEHSSIALEGCGNTFRLDCVLRCYQSCLSDEKCYLNEVEIAHLLEQLKPVYSLMTERALLNRQIK